MTEKNPNMAHRPGEEDSRYDLHKLRAEIAAFREESDSRVRATRQVLNSAMSFRRSEGNI